jgi:hypothetical protein
VTPSALNLLAATFDLRELGTYCDFPTAVSEPEGSTTLMTQVHHFTWSSASVTSTAQPHDPPSHLHLDPRNGYFTTDFLIQILDSFPVPHFSHTLRPLYSPRMKFPNNTGWPEKSRSPSLCRWKRPNFSLTSSFVRPNMFQTHAYTSLTLTDHTSRPYETHSKQQGPSGEVYSRSASQRTSRLL